MDANLGVDPRRRAARSTTRCADGPRSGQGHRQPTGEPHGERCGPCGARVEGARIEGASGGWIGGEEVDWGPYEPWVRPLALLSQERRSQAAAALREVPDPPRDLLLEALWCLVGRAAVAVGDRETAERVHAGLLPPEGELAGAGSGVLTLGPVACHLADLAAALGRTRQSAEHRARASRG